MISSFISFYVWLISILSIYVIFQTQFEKKRQNDLRIFHKYRMIVQIEMNVLFLILIWGENVKITGNSLVDIRNNQIVNMISYHQDSLSIDDKYSFVDLAKESQISSLFHFEGYGKVVYRLSLQNQ
jgi:hypothetical protein